MKWLCLLCRSINAELATRCHYCDSLLAIESAALKDDKSKESKC